jgi:hypothetical protein
MKAFNISGVRFEIVQRESCDRLVQFYKGLPITCKCTRCAARNQTPEQARASCIKANGGAA